MIVWTMNVILTISAAFSVFAVGVSVGKSVGEGNSIFGFDPEEDEND